MNWVPQMWRGVERLKFENHIARKPDAILIDGVAATARIGNISQSRTMMLSSFHNIAEGIECMIALEDGAEIPEALKTKIVYNNITYLVIDVETTVAKDCYILTLSKTR